MGLAVGVNKCKIMLNSRKDGARRIDKVSRYHEGQCVARTCGSLHAESTIVKMAVEPVPQTRGIDMVKAQLA